MVDTENYLFRITVLSALALLAPRVTPTTLHSLILPLVLSRATDPVPNVRFNVAKVLTQLHTALSTDAPEAHARALEVLVALSADSDSDVQFYANQALSAYQ